MTLTDYLKPSEVERLAELKRIKADANREAKRIKDAARMRAIRATEITNTGDGSIELNMPQARFLSALSQTEGRKRFDLPSLSERSMQEIRLHALVNEIDGLLYLSARGAETLNT